MATRPLGCAFTPVASGWTRPNRRNFCCWLAAMPGLAALQQGSDEYPDESATCVIEVQALNDHGPGWLLQGPGILGQRTLRVDGMHQDFQAQWTASHAQFPRGVDVFLASPTQVVGLPRTTRILNSAEV
jgi:alpha-D-ribose 1-methylphosphonate 5-triphosphate synthase subunit PhnH